jgi:hypothetical protein
MATVAQLAECRALHTFASFECVGHDNACSRSVKRKGEFCNSHSFQNQE